MQWKQPKNSNKYHWTQHVTEKMHYYGLSEQKVLNVIRNPKRTETGIVENTVAVMMPVGNMAKKDNKTSKWKKTFVSDENNDEKWNQEIWVMYQIKGVGDQPSVIGHQQKGKNKDETLKNLKLKINNLNRKICIISAWRYPGVSPKNNPIPEEIIKELEEISF